MGAAGNPFFSDDCSAILKGRPRFRQAAPLGNEPAAAQGPIKPPWVCICLHPLHTPGQISIQKGSPDRMECVTKPHPSGNGARFDHGFRWCISGDRWRDSSSRRPQQKPGMVHLPKGGYGMRPKFSFFRASHFDCCSCPLRPAFGFCPSQTFVHRNLSKRRVSFRLALSE